MGLSVLSDTEQNGACPWLKWWLTLIPRIYFVFHVGSNGCTAVGHPLRLSLSRVISHITEGRGARGSDPYPPLLLRCDQTTAHGYCSAVLPSIVTQLAAAGFDRIRTSLAAKV